MKFAKTNLEKMVARERCRYAMTAAFLDTDSADPRLIATNGKALVALAIELEAGWTSFLSRMEPRFQGR